MRENRESPSKSYQDMCRFVAAEFSLISMKVWSIMFLRKLHSGCSGTRFLHGVQNKWDLFANCCVGYKINWCSLFASPHLSWPMRRSHATHLLSKHSCKQQKKVKMLKLRADKEYMLSSNCTKQLYSERVNLIRMAIVWIFIDQNTHSPTNLISSFQCPSL